MLAPRASLAAGTDSEVCWPWVSAKCLKNPHAGEPFYNRISKCQNLVLIDYGILQRAWQQHLRDVGAGDEQVAGPEVADGARVGHAARPDAQLTHAPQRVCRRAVTFDVAGSPSRHATRASRASEAPQDRGCSCKPIICTCDTGLPALWRPNKGLEVTTRLL